jgi:hypothetical protein
LLGVASVSTAPLKPHNLMGVLANQVLLEPIHFIMERKMLLGIKECAESISECKSEQAVSPIKMSRQNVPFTINAKGK